jgi:hypothetical protein
VQAVNIWAFADKHPVVFLLAVLCLAFPAASLGPLVIVRKDKP